MDKNTKMCVTKMKLLNMPPAGRDLNWILAFSMTFRTCQLPSLVAEPWRFSLVNKITSCSRTANFSSFFWRGKMYSCSFHPTTAKNLTSLLLFVLFHVINTSSYLDFPSCLRFQCIKQILQGRGQLCTYNCKMFSLGRVWGERLMIEF